MPGDYDLALRAERDRLANALSYALGQLGAVHMDARVHLEYPGIAQLLRRDELHRGFEDGRAWLRDLQDRHAQKNPSNTRGATALTAARLGGL